MLHWFVVDPQQEGSVSQSPGKTNSFTSKTTNVILHNIHNVLSAVQWMQLYQTAKALTYIVRDRVLYCVTVHKKHCGTKTRYGGQGDPYNHWTANVQKWCANLLGTLPRKQHVRRLIFEADPTGDGKGDSWAKYKQMKEQTNRTNQIMVKYGNPFWQKAHSEIISNNLWFLSVTDTSAWHLLTSLNNSEIKKRGGITAFVYTNNKRCYTTLSVIELQTQRPFLICFSLWNRCIMLSCCLWMNFFY